MSSRIIFATQIAELNAAGLTADEAFLIAVKRMGDVDALSREFAREHSGRLWKQLLAEATTSRTLAASGWLETLAFAVAAAVAIQVARLAADVPEEEPTWLVRNVESVRAAVPRRVLRPPAAARRPPVGC